MSLLQILFGTRRRDNQASEEIKLDSSANENVVIDPKVFEYFKDLPEPYREKVVQRYSKREGIYQLDFFRDMAMKNERKMIERGIFKQDEIDHEETLKELQKYEMEIKEKEMIQRNLEREIPEWEKTLQQFIPLQVGDTMAFKLFQSINLSLIGATLIWVSLSLKKKKPSKSKLYSSVAMGVIGCVCSQTLAVCRLMDWGLLTNQPDSRDIFVKSIDDLKEASRLIQNYLNIETSQKIVQEIIYLKIEKRFMAC